MGDRPGHRDQRQTKQEGEACHSPEQLRREVLTQHATLDAMSEAREVTQERLRSLERFADLASLADEAT